ncbi:MAG: S1C family serine protease [Bacteroidales bacterium]|jgi:S1-C subfamily serine protease|nr:S1C family serine protease [Bacteroidales bacterium]
MNGLQPTTKKELSKTVITVLATIILVSSLVFVYFLSCRIPSSKEIFSDAQHFVVELKSQSQDSMVIYGSAVIIDGEGTIVSNAHMVTYKESGLYETYESFEVRFSFEIEYHPVTLIKYDISQDIAILKFSDLSDVTIKSTKISNNSKVKSGDKVYAVGNGMNHGIGISQGIVSLPKVNIEYDGIVRSVIQCDITINEGNSGGALLDEKGRLIGIVSFRIKDNQGNPIYGIAFSIPINSVLSFL